MTQLTHGRIRDALARGHGHDEVPAHLRRCDSCQRFAESLQRLDAVVVDLAPPPAPEDLAERVLAGTQSAGADPGHRRSVRRSARRSATALSAVGAAAAVLLAVLVFQDEEPTDPGTMALIGAAEHLEDDGTAAVQVEGTIDVAVRRGDADPDFSGLPTELEAHFETQWTLMMADFEQRMAEFEQQVDDVLDQADELLDGFGMPPSSRPGPGPAPDGATGQHAEPKPLPEHLSLRIDVSASGVVDVDGRLELDGSVRPSGGSVPTPDTPVPFGLSVDDGRGVIRRADGTRGPVYAGEGPIASLLTRPDALAELLRGVEGEVAVEGRMELHGEEVDRYQFRVEGFDAVASIGSDGRLRTLTLLDEARDGGVHWRSSVDVAVTDFGVVMQARAPIAPPPAGTVPAAPGGEGLLQPLGPVVAEALRGVG